LRSSRCVGSCKGYRPPINLATVVMGMSSLINAAVGWHQATIARNGVAILGKAGERRDKTILSPSSTRCRERCPVSCLSTGFWALVAGLLASLVVERDQLLNAWRHAELPSQTRR
jgi:predicted benzoate:H+ symporter BenE